MPGPSTSSSSSSKEGTAKFLDVSLKVLSGLVIPLIVWGVKLEVKNAIQDERISEVQEELDKLADVTDAVQNQALAMVRLEGKLDNLDEKIDDVKKLLSRAP
jgi:peptidoglycan hydrolase CwlO-like protein